MAAATKKASTKTKTEYDESINVSETSAKIMKSKAYKAIKKDLIEQIVKAGADTPVFLSLIETYMDFYLTKEQVHIVNNIMGKIYIKDLSMFNMYERLDLVLYKINKHLLKMYLRLIAKIHPIEFEIK